MQRLIREPGFAQTSLPLQAFVSAQSAAPEQVQVQSFWHPSPFTMLPSSHCSGAVTMADPLDLALAFPRALMRPVHLLLEHGMRRPLRALVTAVEKTRFWE